MVSVTGTQAERSVRCFVLEKGDKEETALCTARVLDIFNLISSHSCLHKTSLQLVAEICT